MSNVGPLYEDAYKMWAEQMAGRVLDPTFLKQQGIIDTDMPTDNPEFWKIVYDRMTEATEQGEGLLDLHGRLTEQVQGLADSTEEAAKLSSKKFNLRKNAQGMNLNPFESPSSDEMPEAQYADEMLDPAMQEEMAKPMQFRDAAELRDVISDMGPLDASQMLKSQMEDDDVIQSGGKVMDSMQVVDDAMDYFFSIPEEDASEREKAAMMLFEAIPASMKVRVPDNHSIIQAPLREASMHKDYLKEVADTIKQMAHAVVRRRKEAHKSFNIRKQAQHHSDQNVILWGPGQTRPDPFLMGQPVSDWHIIERNKGFGQDVDGIWNIDWEAVWRGNVMDKYSRPYRDEDGNWVGGYIQKRFEVDKWIPEWNNLQLKPGQRRRPYLPQYGSTEARLEHMRKEDKRGYGPQSDGNPTMWSESEFAKMSVGSKKFNMRKHAFDFAPPPAAGGMQPNEKPAPKAPLSDIFALLDQMQADRQVNEAERDFAALPQSEQDSINQEIDADLDEMYNSRPELDNMSPVQVGDAAHAAGEDQGMHSPEVQTRMKAREMTDQMFPVAVAKGKNKKSAQTDVSTERQLQNAKGNASTQRHNGPDTELGGDAEYADNFGRPIVDNSKKKARMIEPTRR